MRDFSDDLADLRRRVEARTLPADRRRARPRRRARGRGQQARSLGRPGPARRKVNTELARLREDVELVDGLDGTRLRPRDARRARARGERRVGRAGDRRRARALGRRARQLELRALFTGEHDDRDAICTVNSGAGGTDAQDWTDMLLRMYLAVGGAARLRHRDRRGVAGHGGGLSSATFTIKGRYAYGLLASERACTGSSASHRSTRTRAARPRSRRSTSCPRSRRPKCPRSTRTTCASTRTGRRVRAASTSTSPTPRSASRTCRPASSCRARTSARRRRTRRERCRSSPRASPSGSARSATPSCVALSGEKRDVAFGSQIRTYTLQPYQLVKDERTRLRDRQRAGGARRRRRRVHRVLPAVAPPADGP